VRPNWNQLLRDAVILVTVYSCVLLTGALAFAWVMGPAHSLHSPATKSMEPLERVPIALHGLAIETAVTSVYFVIAYGCLRLVAALRRPSIRPYCLLVSGGSALVLWVLALCFQVWFLFA
jgi:hypothetical protein